MNNIIKFKKSHWSLALEKSMKDPKFLISEDDLVVVIKDKFPKAKHHYLVVSKEDISTIFNLDTSHLLLLQHMEKIGNSLMKNIGVNYKIGFHAKPSMLRLHMHCISQDMISTCLKHKKHWNGFTTEFFIKSDELIKQVRDDGKVTKVPDDEVKELLNRPLKCHLCSYLPKNMPTLKEHLLKHEK